MSAFAFLQVAQQGIEMLGGGPRRNSNHDNLSNPDPLVWHNGEPYDGSKGKEHNMPLYLAQKQEIMDSNRGLHDAFEQFKKSNGDPTRSQWEKFAAPHLVAGKEKKKGVPNPPIEEIKTVKSENPLKATKETLSATFTENKAVVVVVGVAVVGYGIWYYINKGSKAVYNTATKYRRRKRN